MLFSVLKSRRQVLELGTAIGLTTAGAFGSLMPERAFAQAATQAGPPSSGKVPTMEELLAPQALPDIWQGSADAPVTMIEYASMTCPHCAAFAHDTFPVLKSKYIDTGKVHFVLREFPFDPFATAAFMLARCVGPDKRDAMVELLFAQQKNWAYVDKPLQGLTNVVKQTGMGQDQFNACLNDKTLYGQVNQVRDTAAHQFGVDATPTFFVNGKKVEGEMSIADLDNLLQPLLANKG
jgi:protein-disulfide isomerase